MVFPAPLQKLVDQNKIPQRLLLSGNGGFEVALDLAAQIQNVDRNLIEKGIHADTLVLRDEGKSFKIDYSDAAKRDNQGEHENARGLIRWMLQSPIGAGRIVILENFERCSHESPQALLKILEEPPSRGYFFFTTRNHYQILPTIRSRVTHFSALGDEAFKGDISLESQFLESESVLERFQIIERLSSEEKESESSGLFLAFVDGLISICRKNPKAFRYLESLLSAYEDLESNVNKRLLLERIALKWSKK